MAMNYTPPINAITSDGVNKKLDVIFLIDCSTSMTGAPINSVNIALREVISELSDFSENNTIDIYISIMSFTSNAKWELKSALLNKCNSFDFNDIEVRKGLTQYGVAFHELNRTLNKTDLMNHTGKIAKPVILFMSDGAPDDDYSYDLEKLRNNEWFNNSFRNAILTGEAVDKHDAEQAVNGFISDDGAILKARDCVSIVNKIELATIHTLQGKPKPVGSFQDNSSNNQSLKNTQVKQDTDSLLFNTVLPQSNTVTDDNNIFMTSNVSDHNDSDDFDESDTVDDIDDAFDD